MRDTCRYKQHFYMLKQGIPQQPGTRQIGRLIAFPPSYFVFKNENVKVKVKYGFVLQDPPFYFRIITSYLKMSGMPCKKCSTITIQYYF